MKTNIKTIILLALTLSFSLTSSLVAQHSRPIEGADVNGILGGRKPATLHPSAQDVNPFLVELEAGYYKAQSKDHQEKEYDILVQDYVNHPDQKLVIMIEQPVLMSGRMGYGWIYHAKPIKNGASVMLAPISISARTGNLVISSENERRAPVIIISKRQGLVKYPFFLQGQNGALDGQLLQMRKIDRNYKPRLRQYPDDGYFAAGNENGPQLIIANQQLAQYRNNQVNQTFDMIDLNLGGTFVGLTESEFDTMLAADIGHEQIKKLGIFFDSCYGKQESFLIANPTHDQGKYKFEVFGLAKPNLVERFINKYFY